MKQIKNKKRKLLKIIGVTTAAAPITITLASCSVANVNTDTIKWATTANPFSNSKVPLGTTFVDSPATTFFNSLFLNLVNYKTTGKYAFNSETGEAIETPMPHMHLEGAKQIDIYYTAEQKVDVSDKEDNSTPMQKIVNKEGKEVKKYIHTISDNKDNPYFDVSKAIQALNNATKVDFTIRDGLKWRDKDGNIVSDVTAKDFYAGMTGYYRSVQYGLNANSYFFSLAGIDVNKTLDKSNEPNNNKFTVYMTSTPSPYLLDIITKGYFAAMPYNNPEVKPILSLGTQEDTNNPIKLTNDGKVIDQVNTDWDRVFGGGNQQTDVDVWSAGPYYIHKTTLQDVDFRINDSYFNSVNGVGNLNEKIKNVILFYGNSFGTPEKIYRGFTTGELDYAPVPAAQQLEAVLKYTGTGNLQPVISSKTTQGQFIAYNTDIYNSYGSLKSNVGKVYANFVDKFYTEGKKIRKAINLLINYPKLAELVWKPGKYDYALSSSPYGYLSYKKQGEEKSTLQYQQIRNGNFKINNEDITGIAGDFNRLIKIDDYVIPQSMMDEKEKQIFRDLNSALDSIGAKKDDPLKLDYRTLVSTYTPEQTKFLQQLIDSIRIISDGRIVLNLVNRTNQTVTDYFYNANSPMGTFLWGPDYNAVGTWVGYYFQYNYDGNGKPIMVANQKETEVNKGISINTKMPQLWPLLFQEMQEALKTSPMNGNDSFNNETGWKDKQAWLRDLWNHLVAKGSVKKWDGANNNLKASDYKVTDISSSLDSQIAIWGDLNQFNTYALVQWIDSQYPFIPNYESGLDYKSFNVVRSQFDVLPSLNSNTNFKDWSLKKNN